MICLIREIPPPATATSEGQSWSQQQKAKMTPSELEAIREQTRRMKNFDLHQDEFQIDSLLSRGSIDINAPELPIEIISHRNIPISLHDVPSNGIALVTFQFDCRDLSLNDIRLLDLANDLAPRSDTPAVTALERRIRGHRYTGDFYQTFLSNEYNNGTYVTDPTEFNLHRVTQVKVRRETVLNALSISIPSVFDRRAQGVYRYRLGSTHGGARLL